MAERVSIGRVPTVGRRPWNDALSVEVQDFFWRLKKAIGFSVPPGFDGVTPSDIGFGSGDPGTEAAGWAAADHEHGFTLPLIKRLSLESVSNGTYPMLQLPYAATLTGIRAIRADLGPVGTVDVDLYLNGSPISGTTLSVSTSWQSLNSLSVPLAVDDYIDVVCSSVTGTVTYLVVQIELTRP